MSFVKPLSHLLKTFCGWTDEQLRDGTVPKRRRTREQNRAAAITAERRANRQHHTDPTPPSIPDEYLEYDDTFTTATDSDPPPF
jgi:hypothetical protein